MQRDQVGPRSAWKAQLKLHRVVHRVIGAQRQKQQVEPLGVKRRGVVAELGLRGQQGLAAVDAIDLCELDRRVANAGGKSVGQPAAAGRPDGVFDAAKTAVVHALQCAAVGVADPQFVAVVGEGHARARRRCAQRGDATQRLRGPGQRTRACAGDQLDLLFARCVAGADEAGAVGQPLAQAAARRRVAMLARRTFPQRHREELATRFERQAVTLGMQRNALQVVGHGHKAPGGLGARAGHLDGDALRLRTGRIEQPQIGAALVDDAPAVAAGISGVMLDMIGMALLVAAVAAAGPQVADAVDIVDVVQALAHPHRVAGIALDLQ